MNPIYVCRFKAVRSCFSEVFIPIDSNLIVRKFWCEGSNRLGERGDDFLVILLTSGPNDFAIIVTIASIVCILTELAYAADQSWRVTVLNDIIDIVVWSVMIRCLCLSG